MPEKWKTDLSRITPEARAIVDEMEQVYVGPDGDRKTIREVGDWRTILDMAGERIAALEAELAEVDTSWLCPECGSFDSREVSHPDDFGSRACNACGYVGNPGEDFPTRSRLVQRARVAEARVAALEALVRRMLPGLAEELIESARKEGGPDA